ncbi:MAG: class I SAM-dependent methyltransferase [Caulobacteraceae bacterium]
MSLKARLAAEIAAHGPIGVAEFMTRCLFDPQDGYYATRPAIGAQGDFVTAPTVSQMFGELIGAWLVETWRGLGSPARVALVEAGPGDATLMSDILRVARLAPGFLAAAEVWLIEASAPLKALQAERLAAATPRWASSIDETPADVPLLLVANEFLDCLPVRQFERRAGGWAERTIGLDGADALAFGLRPAAFDGPRAPTGAVIERSPAQTAFAEALAARIVSQGGAALIVDYGAAEPGCGDTLQAVSGGRKVGPLEAPGEADLTAHVDFPGVLEAARAAGAEVALLSQGEFLSRLGLADRAAALGRARPDQAAMVARQAQRLAGDDQMGALFKAAAIWSGSAPPAFEAVR